jgi:hypothetical protein
MISGKRSLRQLSAIIPPFSIQSHCRRISEGVSLVIMSYIQADLFAQDNAERNTLSETHRLAIRARLEATLAKLEAAASFPWRNPLDAVHEENRFQRDSETLGEEGALLWAKFDKEMDRLHATRFSPDGGMDESTH